VLVSADVHRQEQPDEVLVQGAELEPARGVAQQVQAQDVEQDMEQALEPGKVQVLELDMELV